ncbi:integrase/recombinase xerD homolog [Lissotriton helveticus]
MAPAAVALRIRELGEMSVAPRMMRRYQTCVKTFCKVMGPWELEDSRQAEKVQAFMVWARDEGKSHSWMAGHLSAIGHHARLAGQNDPTTAFTTRAALKGWARVMPRVADQRAPIDYDTLKNMIDALPTVTHSAYESALFASTFSLAFFGAFRIGELVARSKKESNTRAITVRDVRATAESVEIFLHSSKTDQSGKGRNITLQRLGNDSYCPVSLLAAFLHRRPQTDGLLLIHSDCSPVTKYQVEHVMQGCLFLAGYTIEGAKFSTHSFRIGAATTAFRAGLPAETIKKVGRWESNCYRRYVRPLGVILPVSTQVTNTSK